MHTDRESVDQTLFCCWMKAFCAPTVVSEPYVVAVAVSMGAERDVPRRRTHYFDQTVPSQPIDTLRSSTLTEGSVCDSAAAASVPSGSSCAAAAAAPVAAWTRSIVRSTRMRAAADDAGRMWCSVRRAMDTGACRHNFEATLGRAERSIVAEWVQRPKAPLLAGAGFDGQDAFLQTMPSLLSRLRLCARTPPAAETRALLKSTSPCTISLHTPRRACVATR